MEKIKASVLLEKLLLITEAALSEEDEKLFKKLSDNHTLFDKNNIPINLSSCFTFEQACELNKLLGKAISLSQVNSNSIIECHRLAYIRCTILLLIEYNLIEKDIDISDNEIYRKIVLNILPEYTYLK